MKDRIASFDTAEAAGRLTTSQLAAALGVDFSPSDKIVLDAEALSRVAAHITARRDLLETTRARWDDPAFWNVESSPAERSQFFTVGNAINFRFWQLEGDRVVPAVGTIEGHQFRGAMYMWRSLRIGLDRGFPLLDAAFLGGITDADFDAIFGDDSGRNPISIAREDRTRNLRDLGAKLKEDWGGLFYNVIEAARGSMIEFVRLSAKFRAFDDPIYKLAMVNAILHSGSGVTKFDADPLPGVDYQLLKHLLRQGILLPSREIRAKIAGKRLLEHEEALELRRTALVAFVELSRQTGLSGETLDNGYWWNRQHCTDEAPVCSDPSTAQLCPFYGACSMLIDLALPLEMTRYY